MNFSPHGTTKSHLNETFIISPVLSHSLSRKIAEFPDMLHDSPVKTKAQNLICKMGALEEKKKNQNIQIQAKLNKRIKILNERLQAISCDLVVDGNCRFELRFHPLDYKLCWKLQTDELVERTLTPQSKASIRIVIGTLSSFSRLHLVRF